MSGCRGLARSVPPRYRSLPLLAFVLAVVVAPVLAQAPRPAEAGTASPLPTLDITKERANLEVQLSETLRQREAIVPGGRDTASPDSVRAADRHRLLDRLVFLQGERIKRLDALGALQAAAPFSLTNLPMVRALGEGKPYSALAVDGLRDELAGVRDRMQAIDSGVAAREAEKQLLAERLRRADEALRLASDQLAADDGDRPARQEALELARLRRRMAEAELALLATDIDTLRRQGASLEIQAGEMGRLVSRVLPDQRLTEHDLATLKERMVALTTKFQDEAALIRQRQLAREKELAEIRSAENAADAANLPRQHFLERALLIDGSVLEGLNGLQLLAQVTTDIWEKRYLGLTAGGDEHHRQMLASLHKIYQGLVSRKRLSQEQREASAVALRDLDTKVANLPPGSPEQQFARDERVLLQEQTGIHERLELAASRLERQISRWLADFSQAAEGSLSGRVTLLSEELRAYWQAFWNYELFAVEDVSDVDGRKISVFYGITVGKSVGAALLFIVGYWLFSRLSQRLLKLLVRRFGISSQLASVIRRWAMILLAVGLMVFILNLARIPLTVFAFMGGALAIGIGFGTQTIIKNFISGVIILFERKVRVGDIIELGGMTGHVTAVDLRATTVRGFNGVEALVPNSSFLENQVVNWTYSNPQIRRELSIGVAYGADSSLAAALLVKAAGEHDRVLRSPAPEVYFEDFADNALLMVLVFWVELGPETVARRVDSDLRHTIYRRLAEAGIGIPFPQRDVHLDVSRPIPVVVMELGE